MNSPKGKLYTKYFNTIRSMKQSGLLSKIPKEKSSKLICRTMDKNNRLLGNVLMYNIILYVIFSILFLNVRYGISLR